MLGAFHIEGSIYSAIGGIIKDSAGSYLLTEPGVIAPRSMKRSIKEKMHNLFKRGHKRPNILRGLHSQSFHKGHTQ